MRSRPSPSLYAAHWSLDPNVVFLNHGSYGATPRVVMQHQQELREEIEREPVQFFKHKLERKLDEARAELALFLGAAAEDLAFIVNTTTGVNAVLRSIGLKPGDEIIVSNHEYPACRNAADFAAAASGARVVVAELRFPAHSESEIVECFLRCVTPNTRLLLVDHVTAPTGLVLPLKRIVDAMKARGVDTLVDGAHAIGMVELDLNALGAAYYVGNCHKWLCAPKGAAILHARGKHQERLRPLVISHGASSTRNNRSRFLQEFDWPGTYDPTPMLSVPRTLAFLRELSHDIAPTQPSGNLTSLIAYNRRLTLDARNAIAARLGSSPQCLESMVGFLSTHRLPDADTALDNNELVDPLQAALFERFGIEVPIWRWGSPTRRYVRISCQAYNAPEQYTYLAEALATILAV